MASRRVSVVVSVLRPPFVSPTHPSIHANTFLCHCVFVCVWRPTPVAEGIFSLPPPNNDDQMPVKVETTTSPPPPANSKQLGVSRTLLYNGSRFEGSQKSKGNSYAVEVVLQVGRWLMWQIWLTQNINHTRDILLRSVWMVASSDGLMVQKLPNQSYSIK